MAPNRTTAAAPLIRSVRSWAILLCLACAALFAGCVCALTSPAGRYLATVPPSGVGLSSAIGLEGSFIGGFCSSGACLAFLGGGYGVRMADDPVLAGSQPLKEYIGYIWIGDEPGIRLSIWARDADDAVALVEAEHGEGHEMSIWNEDDASRPR